MNALKTNEANIVPCRLSSRTTWQVYCGDGYYAKLLTEQATRERAVNFCLLEGLTIKD